MKWTNWFLRIPWFNLRLQFKGIHALHISVEGDCKRIKKIFIPKGSVFLLHTCICNVTLYWGSTSFSECKLNIVLGSGKCFSHYETISTQLVGLFSSFTETLFFFALRKHPPNYGFFGSPISHFWHDSRQGVSKEVAANWLDWRPSDASLNQPTSVPHNLFRCKFL